MVARHRSALGSRGLSRRAGSSAGSFAILLARAGLLAALAAGPACTYDPTPPEDTRDASPDYRDSSGRGADSPTDTGAASGPTALDATGAPAADGSGDEQAADVSGAIDAHPTDTPHAPDTGDCANGDRRCENSCIAASACCTDQDCPTCRVCMAGTCTDQTPGEDKKNECGGRGCNAGACRTCNPTSGVSCMGDELRTCNAAGTGYTTVDDCGGNGCTGTTCKPCRANASTCRDNQWKVCSASGTEYSTDQSCGDRGCDAAAIRCNICKPGANQCDDQTGTRTICNAAGTEETTITCDCPGFTICDGKCHEMTPYYCADAELPSDTYSFCSALDLSGKPCAKPPLGDACTPQEHNRKQVLLQRQPSGSYQYQNTYCCWPGSNRWIVGGCD